MLTMRAFYVLLAVLLLLIVAKLLTARRAMRAELEPEPEDTDAAFARAGFRPYSE